MTDIDAATQAEMLQRLKEPFPPEALKTRKGAGNRSFTYIEGHAVINRLNAVTGGRWDLQVLKIWDVGDLMLAQVKLSIPGLGEREHIGVQKVDPKAGEDIVKGVITDALKKAATLFGVGLYLYGSDYERDDYAEDVPPTPQERERRMAPVHREAQRQGIAPVPPPPAPIPIQREAWVHPDDPLDQQQFTPLNVLWQAKKFVGPAPMKWQGWLDVLAMDAPDADVGLREDGRVSAQRVFRAFRDHAGITTEPEQATR